MNFCYNLVFTKIFNITIFHIKKHLGFRVEIGNSITNQWETNANKSLN